MTFSQGIPTPQVDAPTIAVKIGVEKLVVKREDLHPLGSHKGRSLPFMIQKGIEKGATHFAISSSGNAARAAVLTFESLPSDKKATLDVFIGSHIAPEKRSWLLEHASESIKIIESARPLQSLFEAEKNGAYPLRQSTSEDAPIGYVELGKELESIQNLSHIFVPASSGTLAVGLGRFFSKNNPPIKIHVVQTEAVHPFSNVQTKSEFSIADAIVNKVGYRKQEVLDIVSKSGGSVIVPTDATVLEAQKLLAEENIIASANGALALAGLISAKQNEQLFSGTVCVLVCGR